jgi:thymidylate kinase
MIVELFGSPGAGKTTFARALAARLHERGHTVDLILSHRPAEHSPHQIRRGLDLSTQQISSTIRRLTRPFAETLTMVRHPFTLSHDVGTALTLIKILPPSSIFWSLRLAQYVSRLSRAWLQASNNSHIVLFDQAFVQAVCSLVLFCGAADELLISNALDAIPKSDLLVRLDAPAEILEARLRDRERLEGRVGRLLELDLATNLRSSAIVDCLQDLLRKAGRQVTNAASLDQLSLHNAVEQVEKLITVRFSVEQRQAERPNQVCADSIRVDQPLERHAPFDPGSQTVQRVPGRGHRNL